MTEFKIPTETVELPSKGLLYPKDSPLAEGKIELKYMTAKEEDILTNQNYIKQGVVIDKLLQSLIVTKINYNDLLVGDKNAIMVAARILSYGAKYNFGYDGMEQEIDLSTLENKPLSEEVKQAESNNFTFTLPHSGNVVTFKLLNHGDEGKIDNEIKGLKKLNKEGTPDVTVRLSYMITSINGSEDRKDIREFVNNYFLAKDAREFRKYYGSISPDVDLTVTLIDSNGDEEDTDLPIGISFFFGLTPDYRTSLFRQIHDIVFHGNGGYDWHTVYNMPIWLRNLTFNLINNHYKEQNSQNNPEESWTKGKAKQAASERKKITPPTYVTKASKK